MSPAVLEGQYQTGALSNRNRPHPRTMAPSVSCARPRRAIDAHAGAIPAAEIDAAEIDDHTRLLARALDQRVTAIRCA
jgi:hypothetical protein